MLLVFAFGAMIAMGLSMARLVLRVWFRGSCAAEKVRNWRWVSMEGAVVGAVVSVITLTAAPRDIYVSPSGLEQIEFRLPCLIEGPLGLHPCSDVFVPVTVTHTDAQGRRTVQHGAEGIQETPAMRVLSRDIEWSSEVSGNTIVVLSETGTQFSFPALAMEHASRLPGDPAQVKPATP